MQMSQQDGESASNMNQDQMVNETQGRMQVISNQIRDPVSTRYDDIYHPRTDKKVIRKFSILTVTHIYRRKPVYILRKHL